MVQPAGAAGDKPAAVVDLALVLAVDISNSIDPAQYQLQMAGIAPGLRGQGRAERHPVRPARRHHRDARRLVGQAAHRASRGRRSPASWRPSPSPNSVRDLPRIAGNFTCMADALHFVGDRVLPLQPLAAERRIVDVSGDGRGELQSRGNRSTSCAPSSSPKASPSTACRSWRDARPTTLERGIATTSSAGRSRSCCRPQGFEDFAARHPAKIPGGDQHGAGGLALSRRPRLMRPRCVPARASQLSKQSFASVASS